MPVRHRLPRQHRNHGTTPLASVAADLQHDQGWLASWLKRAPHLPVAETMAVQTEATPWLVAGLATPGTSPWPDRVDGRRLKRPALDVHLASND
jgi:hypothetical protein